MHNAKHILRVSARRRHLRRGFTMIEMMIATSTAALVMGAVISLQVISGKTIVEIYEQTRTRSSRMIAIDQIRYRLNHAKIGTAVITDNGHRIRFTDPTLGAAVTSEFLFLPVSNTLYYDADVSASPATVKVAEGPIDITFQSQSLGAIIKFLVKTESDQSYGDIDEQEGETAVYLRNA